MIIVPGHEQAATDQVIDFSFLRRQYASGRDWRGNNGVMVRNFAVINKATAQRALAGSCCQPIPIRFLNRRHHCAQRSRDRHGEMAAVGARIADQFMLFIQFLGDVQGVLCAEAEEPVGVAL